MNKLIKSAVIFGCAAFGWCAFAAEMVVSSGEVTPGVWNTSYVNTRSYAEEHNLPLVIFYAKDGCSECKKLKNAVAEADFVAWQKEKQYVFCFMLGANSTDHSQGRTFIKQGYESLTQMPMVCVYWLKSDGTSIRQTFVGRNSKMPASGSSLGEKLMNSIEKILGSSSSKQSDTGDTAVIPAEWGKIRNLTAAVYDADGEIAGTATIKAGKANTKTGIAKVTVKVQLLGGKVKSLGTESMNVKTTDTVKFDGRNGSMELKFSSAGVEGVATIGGASYGVQTVKIGGTFPAQKMQFVTDEMSSTYGESYPVFTEWLPTNQVVSASGSRFSIAKAGRVSYDRSTGTFKNSSTDNPAGLTLKYKSSTGYLSGYFYLYCKISEKKFKKVKVTLTGYVVDGVGVGVMTGRSFGPYSFDLVPVK